MDKPFQSNVHTGKASHKIESLNFIQSKSFLATFLCQGSLPQLGKYFVNKLLDLLVLCDYCELTVGGDFSRNDEPLQFIEGSASHGTMVFFQNLPCCSNFNICAFVVPL